MHKGFNRVWVRCNMVIASLAFAIVGFTHFQTPADAQEAIPVPQIRPDFAAHPGETGQMQSVPEAAPQKPKRIYQSACPALLKGDISAKLLAPIVEGECGERSPLALAAIIYPNQTTLSSTPQINCRMATAMVEWSEKLNEAAEAAFGSPVEVILTGKGYQCRRRNNQANGKISEHGFANAVDITGFKLANGEDVLVARDWRVEAEEPSLNGMFLRTVHKAACEIFTTVLGPQTNEHHKDHFHFDLGCHGKGCEYRVCE